MQLRLLGGLLVGQLRAVAAVLGDGLIENLVFGPAPHLRQLAFGCLGLGHGLLLGLVHLLLGAVDGLGQPLHDDVDGHGHEGQAQEGVDARQKEEVGMLGQHVPEADGAGGDEDEVEGLQVGPVLPQLVHAGAQEDIGEDEADGYQHRQTELVRQLGPLQEDRVLLHRGPGPAHVDPAVLQAGRVHTRRAAARHAASLHALPPAQPVHCVLAW